MSSLSWPISITWASTSKHSDYSKVPKPLQLTHSRVKTWTCTRTHANTHTDTQRETERLPRSTHHNLCVCVCVCSYISISDSLLPQVCVGHFEALRGVSFIRVLSDTVSSQSLDLSSRHVMRGTHNLLSSSVPHPAHPCLTASACPTCSRAVVTNLFKPKIPDLCLGDR